MRPANKPEIAEVDLCDTGAESAERREGTEGNTGEQRTCRTPSRAWFLSDEQWPPNCP